MGNSDLPSLSLHHGIAVLERTPAVFRALLAGLPDAWIVANEGPATFSPFDNLGHLIRVRLAWLDEDAQASAIDTFVAKAAKGTAGWRSTSPSPRIVAEARSFADAGLQLGYADPGDVTDLLRRASKAFHAGDHATARGVFDAVLPPISAFDINLGQHEFVEEVLGVDAQACVAQYAVSVYTTTPLRERAAAVLRVAEQVEGVATLLDPIAEMEAASAGALPDLTTFLPLWVKRLERFRPSREEWDSPHERWLREAVFRVDGAAGLERLAMKTKRPQACLAWCDALIGQGDWQRRASRVRGGGQTGRDPAPAR